jgi:hypothetical protein
LLDPLPLLRHLSFQPLNDLLLRLDLLLLLPHDFQQPLDLGKQL